LYIVDYAVVAPCKLDMVENVLHLCVCKHSFCFVDNLLHWNGFCFLHYYLLFYYLRPEKGCKSSSSVYYDNIFHDESNATYLVSEILIVFVYIYLVKLKMVWLGTMLKLHSFLDGGSNICLQASQPIVSFSFSYKWAVFRASGINMKELISFLNDLFSSLSLFMLMSKGLSLCSDISWYLQIPMLC
jgi:hypothetical protein